MKIEHLITIPKDKFEQWSAELLKKNGHYTKNPEIVGDNVIVSYTLEESHLSDNSKDKRESSTMREMAYRIMCERIKSY